jgi:hypothetical protein
LLYWKDDQPSIVKWCLACSSTSGIVNFMLLDNFSISRHVDIPNGANSSTGHDELLVSHLFVHSVTFISIIECSLSVSAARQPVPLGPKLGSLPAYQWTFIKMFEIDHTALLNPDQPPPEPAKPILASQLLELEKKQRRRFTKQGKDERISTGCGEIDEVLGGGCERGIVVGISAEGVEGLFVCAFFTDTEGGMRLLGAVWAKSRDFFRNMPIFECSRHTWFSSSFHCSRLVRVACFAHILSHYKP